jgi:LysR substrate binding domain.
MAEAGDGVAIIPGKLKFYANDRIRCIPLKGDQYRFDVIAACRKEDKSPAIRKFIQALTESQQMKEG